MDTSKLKHVVGTVSENQPAIIRFFEPVNSVTAQCFNSEFLWLQEAIRPSKIIVLINSEGGSVMCGMSVFSVIQSCPIEVECVIEGIAASMGSIIWAAGKKSYMHDYSILMIHNPFLADKDCEDPNVKNMVNAFRQQVETVYRKRFGLTREKINGIMDGGDDADGTFLTASEAVNAGIIPKEHVIKTSKQVCDKVKNAIEGTKDVSAIKDVMNSIASEVDENKLPELFAAIPKQNEQELLVKQKMEKEKFSFGAVTAQLGFSEDTPVANVTNRITELLNTEAKLPKVENELSELKIQYKGKETEVTNLQGTLDGVNAELQKYKDAEHAAKKAEITTMVEAAIKEGKIEESSKESWISMAENNLDLTKSTLASIPARQKISTEIANDPSNVENAANGLTEAEKKMTETVKGVVGENFELKTF
ncbi:MAG: ATP-dependent Clp protease proteolytic subunit [Prevotella sp.]|jgi:ATP-dependent protease ClpP protease subunit|nr:ATP-dependent Clp protease proteolytic subunit [Prevotella sp.]